MHQPLFMKEYHLSHESHPCKFTNARLLVYNKLKSWRKRTPYSTSVETIWCWYNLKARLTGTETKALSPRFLSSVLMNLKNKLVYSTSMD